jgi:hypothetical protein
MSFYDEASWVLIPEGIKEDVVYAQKPTDGLGDLTFTRASDATRTNSAGLIERTPWNLITFSEMFSDASWTKSNATIGVNTATAPNGTLTADNVSLTASGAFMRKLLNIDSARSYTLSSYFKKSATTGTKTFGFYYNNNAGSPNNGNFTAVIDLTNLTIVTTSGGTLTTGRPTILSSTLEFVGNGWYRASVAFTTGTAAGSTNSEIGYSTVGGVLVDFDAWGAQLVEGTDAKPYFATTNRQDVPRLDYRNADGSLNSCPRLLLEPQRTNSIRNSTMVGAVAGTPGTLPTNWVNSQTAGLSRQIVGVGTENGLPYIDFRFFGTTNTGDGIRIDLETGTSIAAATGQTWAYSLYAKLISGTIPTTSFVFFERNAGGSAVTSGGVAFLPTSTLSRFNSTRTLSGGVTVAFVQTSLSITTANATAYDFTIRIAAPQMELGAYASTFIPTTTAAVTRLADVFSRNNVFTNGFITAAGGTWFVDLTSNIAVNATSDNVGAGFELGDSAGTANNAWKFRQGGGSQRLNIWNIVGGTSNPIYSSTADAMKYAIKWNGTTADIFANGVKVISATSFTATNMEFLRYVANQRPTQMVQSALFPTPLTDAQCIQLTT